MNLVYGSSSSSYMDCVVNFVDGCLLIDNLGFVAPVLAASSLDVPSAVHHAVRMSYRRLYVIIFISLIKFMIVFMICVARSYFGGWRRLLHYVRGHARQPIRLVHSLLFLLLPFIVTYPLTLQGRFPNFYPRKQKFSTGGTVPTTRRQHCHTPSLKHRQPFIHFSCVSVTACLCSALKDWYFPRITCALHLWFIRRCLFWLLWIPVTWMMDSDNSFSALPARKVRTCHCGKRMSSLMKTFILYV